MDYTYSPDEWLSYLENQLILYKPDVDRYEKWYRGDHPLAFATSKFREAFGDLFSEFADNFCELVVDVPVDKLRIEGFDFGSPELNARAWALWKRNNMEVGSRMAHTEAVKTGYGYALVDPITKRITVEHPAECYVEVDPATGERLAGLKRWVGLDGRTFATLYLPDKVYRFVSKSDKASGAPVPRLPHEERLATAASAYEARTDVTAIMPNPFKVVPLIPLENNTVLRRGGKSDLEVAIPLQNATNKLVTDMIVASEYQAFRQRVLTGVEVPKYPDDYPDASLAGKPLPQTELMAAISRTWFIEEADAKVTELGGVDLSNYVGAIEMSIQHIATKTRIPPQYFLASNSTLANVNEQSMAIINDGFVAKVERKWDDFGPRWREVMRLALQADGVTVPKDAEVGLPKWQPITKPSIAAVADALVKLKDLNVPFEWLWTQLGASPEEAADWRKQLDKRTAVAPPPPSIVGPDGNPIGTPKPAPPAGAPAAIAAATT